MRGICLSAILVAIFCSSASAGRIVAEIQGDSYWSRDDLYGYSWYSREYGAHRPYVDGNVRPVREDVSAALYIRNSLEYKVIVSKIYRNALRELFSLPMGSEHTAMLEQTGKSGLSRLPAAVVMSVDQVVLDTALPLSILLGRGYFINPYILPRRIAVMDNLPPLPGAVNFIRSAQSKGIRIVFMSDRVCLSRSSNPCPQQDALIRNLRRLGIRADRENVLLAGSRSPWGANKISRRKFISRNYHVLLQISSSLYDFMPLPMLINARRSGSITDFVPHAILDRWVLLPNPFYGDWHHYEKLKWCGSRSIRSFYCLADGLSGKLSRYSLSDDRDDNFFDQEY
ncbi:HAD family acid phosphatase [Candidatus Ichthyocystis sparus]|uniref:HAD family acid phosphatase n=1 Tax=Candidatus Ichthyocystis sparus TaxID=1561004 RepID=UPI000B826F59|nr:HAD family acid phosphatase [Candidatus Ichthyocystis sparus]